MTEPSENTVNLEPTANFMSIRDFCFVCGVHAETYPTPETWTLWAGHPRMYYLHSCPACSERLMSSKGSLSGTGEAECPTNCTRSDGVKWGTVPFLMAVTTGWKPFILVSCPDCGRLLKPEEGA